MSDNRKNILILSTHNATRSILAEALFRARGNRSCNAYSAGPLPLSEPNPVAVAHLKSLGHDTTFARSKDWVEFTASDAPTMDVVISLDAITSEQALPIWPGNPQIANWPIVATVSRDPVDNAGHSPMSNIYFQLIDRVTLFLGIPFGQLDQNGLQARLDAIGRIDEDARKARQRATR